jgi:predicted nucleic acid-binding protein
MSVFVDTSAVLAMLDGADVRHPEGEATWRRLLGDEDPLVTSSYVLLEAYALIQARIGLDAVRDLRERIWPLVDVEWVGDELHEVAIAALLAANRRQLSLVDCVSFEVMRRLGIRRVFAFDAHFEEQGFEVVPPTT